MKEFRTPLTPCPLPGLTINYNTPVLNIGSCFAQNIGLKLSRLKFNTLINPFGILFNPISIANCLERLLSKQPYKANDLVFNNGLWHSFDHHSSFSGPLKEETLHKINTSLQTATSFLQNTQWVIITLGTAHVYFLHEGARAVANCHKFPASAFEKRCISLEEAKNILTGILSKLTSQFPHLSILLTVSPVRHLKDGFVENQRSKAVLLLAADQMVRQFDQVHYFPAYELVMDDLRDYRFYEKDMIHPNEIAIDYIWEFFQATYFTAETKALMAKIESFVKATSHRPLFPDSPAHQSFIKGQLKAIEQFEGENPDLDFNTEKSQLASQIIE